MYIKKNNLCLDYLDSSSCKNGLILKKLYNSGDYIEIATINFCKARNNCYIVTVDDNLQNNILTYEEYKDFIYLIDEAYFIINKDNGKIENTGC